MNISNSRSHSMALRSAFTPVKSGSLSIYDPATAQSFIQKWLNQTQQFAFTLEDSLNDLGNYQYNARIALLGTMSELFTEVNKLLETDKDFVDLNSADNKNIATFIENNKLEIEGVYEDGKWVTPDDLPTGNDYPTTNTHWVNKTQLASVQAEFQKQMALCADTAPIEVLQKQALFQQLNQLYTFMMQLVAQRGELIKSIIQAIR